MMSDQQQAAKVKPPGIDATIKSDQIPNTHVSDRFKDPIDKAMTIDDQPATDAADNLNNESVSDKKSGDETRY